MEINIEKTHAEMVADLSKPGQDIIDSLTPEKAHALHMAVGVAGEAGELLDAIKKHVIYNKPIDRENVVEELGDLEFYMEGLRSKLGITREETLTANYEKLALKRYKNGYSDQAAQERADKAEEAKFHSHAEVAEAASLTGMAKAVNGELVPMTGIGAPL